MELVIIINLNIIHVIRGVGIVLVSFMERAGFRLEFKSVPWLRFLSIATHISGNLSHNLLQNHSVNHIRHNNLSFSFLRRWTQTLFAAAFQLWNEKYKNNLNVKSRYNLNGWIYFCLLISYDTYAYILLKYKNLLTKLSQKI